MHTKNSKAFMLAAATAALFAGGVTATGVHAEEAKVHCGGVNACKGQSDCATGQNSCKSQNACKDKGYKEMTKTDCEKAGGKVLPQ